MNNNKTSLSTYLLILSVAVTTWYCSPIGSSFEKRSRPDLKEKSKRSAHANGYQVISKKVFVIGKDVLKHPPKEPKFHALTQYEIQNIKQMAKSKISVPAQIYMQAKKKKSSASLVLVMKESGKKLSQRKTTLRNLSIQWNGDQFSVNTPSSNAAEVIRNLLEAGYITAEKSSEIFDRNITLAGVNDRPNVLALRLKSNAPNSFATVGWLLKL